MIFDWIRSRFSRKKEPAFPQTEGDLGMRTLAALDSGDTIDDQEVIDLLMSGPLRIDPDGTVHRWEE